MSQITYTVYTEDLGKVKPIGEIILTPKPEGGYTFLGHSTPTYGYSSKLTQFTSLSSLYLAMLAIHERGLKLREERKDKPKCLYYY